MRKIALLRGIHWIPSLILSQPHEQMSIKHHRIETNAHKHELLQYLFCKNTPFLFYHIIRITIWGKQAVMGFFVQIYLLGKWHLIVQMSKRLLHFLNRIKLCIHSCFCDNQGRMQMFILFILLGQYKHTLLYMKFDDICFKY